MATILLGTLGASIGGSFGTILGISGAVVGKAVGAFAGSFIDRAVINALTPAAKQQGPRLTTSDIQTSTEGTPINRFYGRARLVGQVIWSTRFEEVVETEKSGGKSMGGPKVETTTYTYFGNFAIGLCTGEISGIGRIWADGKELDQTLYTIRYYTGTEDQLPDPLIEAKEGVAPPYRGLAYVVFERMEMTEFGNRIPQLNVEVYRNVGSLEPKVNSVAVIAGNEFGFDTEYVWKVDGAPENRFNLSTPTDWTTSMDRLGQVAPNCKNVMLVMSWFGDDLRCGSCLIQPRVDALNKETEPFSWMVCGIEREDAVEMTYIDGRPAYGGASNDATLIRCIADLKARGYHITALPFIMMDIHPDNSFPNPYSDNASTIGQPPYPWRGRITCSPAPGFAGTVDKTSAAAAQVAAFVGTCLPSHFDVDEDGNMTYDGPDEWSYRRLILYCAKIVQMAGGVDAFVVGSEMIGMTQVRSSQSTYPFVDALIRLAGDVRGMLGSAVEIGYSADWSEYNAHRPGDGTGDVYFNLDPLWADRNIDFIGIDNYLPLSDWRDGSNHLDFNPAGPTTCNTYSYLYGYVEGGEYYDWYYADKAGRDAQERLPITDGAYGKPWVYKQKDIRNWWSNRHFNRPGGVESGSPTAWAPQSKPMRFMELGCPAVDKGSNQPNVFPDPKSVEGTFPHYSSRSRDDVIGRMWIEVMLDYYNDPAHNPVSSVYGAPMLDMGKAYVWAWDARPWPTFPIDARQWGDAPNWETGHWVSGRLGLAPAQETLKLILDEAGFDLFDVASIPSVVDGITLGGIMSTRAILDALRPVYQYDAVESDGIIKITPRIGKAPIATIHEDDLVLPSADSPQIYRRTRAQETDLPTAIVINYADIARDDQAASVEARKAVGGSQRVIDLSVPATMPENLARRICDTELHAAWVARERAEFMLPPSKLFLDPGDVIVFGPTNNVMRLGDIGDSYDRKVSAFNVGPANYSAGSTDFSPPPVIPPVEITTATAFFVDGAMLRDEDSDFRPYIAGFISPSNHGVAAYRSPDLSGFTIDTVLPIVGIVGDVMYDFYSGPVWRWDNVVDLYVRLRGGDISSVDQAAVLNGANVIMIENQSGEWEYIQFTTVELLAPGDFKVSGLLRGQRGTEHAMRNPVPAGARAVFVNAAVSQTNIAQAHVGVQLNWRIGPANRDVGAPDFRTEQHTFRGKGRRPLSPVHLHGKKRTDDSWLISWIRRTRINGDNWEPVDVPLAEESERYTLEILSGEGGAVLRTVENITSPQWVYSLANQVTDFGSERWSFWVRVYQISQMYGRGTPASALIWIKDGIVAP